MNSNINLIRTTEYLFNCDFSSDNFDPDNNEEHYDVATKLLQNYSWNDIFNAWNDYLHQNCKTPESIINFCNLYTYYGGLDYYVPHPYDFIGYIYYMVDINKYWNEAGDLLDNMAITILENSGDLSTTQDPYYQSWKDPRILNAIEEWRKKDS